MTPIAAFQRLRAALLIAVAVLALGPAAQAQVSQITQAGKDAILARPATPFAGAATADVTVVEYLDFNCPYCRKAALTLKALMAADPGVRVLYKDWPIFGGVSIYAARAALAAHWQGRYLAAHNILIDTQARLATEAQVRERLAFAGVDLAQLDRDLAAHGEAIDAILARNDEEARALAFTGTPGLVVGEFVVPGVLELDALKRLAAVSRRTPPAPTPQRHS